MKIHFIGVSKMGLPVAANAGKGAVYVDTSTVSPQASAQAAALLQPAGVPGAPAGVMR